MKKLLLLLFLIPNLVMAKSFLCIAENAAGITQNYGKGTFTSMTFKPTGKFIVKKINNVWKVKNFEDKDDSIATEVSSCEEYKGAYKGDEDEEVRLLACQAMFGSFDIHLKQLRFVSTATGDWLLRDNNQMGDGHIQSGSCSAI